MYTKLSQKLERTITEYENATDPESTEIGKEFAQLQKTMYENKDLYACNEGAKPINRLKNRYKDVLPYDKYRVKLDVIENLDGSDYINASYVEDFLDGMQRYIAAQGPIDESLNDFIRMIWELQVTSIICIANEIEDGRRKFKRYWPEDDNPNPLIAGDYHISKDTSSAKTCKCANYEVQPLTISRGSSQRPVLLYHFLKWPDHDIPSGEGPILDLLELLHKDRTPLSPDTPILVHCSLTFHCSAGCGRTGTIIAIDLCRILIQDRVKYSSSATITKNPDLNNVHEPSIAPPPVPPRIKQDSKTGTIGYPVNGELPVKPSRDKKPNNRNNLDVKYKKNDNSYSNSVDNLNTNSCTISKDIDKCHSNPLDVSTPTYTRQHK
ncbi:unnamed protein product [Didymodactylos carnosus]|uniref:protein-tyrosine-phosphatase n=1 Tax=Didymodactylos carnosus TaxID=1234261 RepID=A0A814M729_9BILA|nr:unnamed protein product [Didymodactylos carnosus]CAF1318823.1 unnamed protein product [Didymodactylos carnosus]CAF3840926.1 unnamed protein product [Didymodactylos carnosus]CAF4128346.1 unnamed protein product [Didymodactylos carnosus]